MDIRVQSRVLVSKDIATDQLGLGFRLQKFPIWLFIFYNEVYRVLLGL